MSPDSYLEVVQSLPRQIGEASSIELCRLPPGQFNKVVVSGMGGSSIAGALLQSYMYKSNVPVFLSRSYSLPEFIDSNTLVIAVSYSGNTEETLTSLRTAYRKGSSIVAVCSGGKLLQRAEEHKIPLIRLPQGLQPRASLAYQLVPMLRLLSSLGMVPDVSSDIASAVSCLQRAPFNERAKVLAARLVGKIPLVYASERFGPVAYRWKAQFNENSKIHAFSNVFPELNHNEIVGYTNLNANYYAIILQDQDDESRVKVRMKIMRDVISKRQVPSTQIAITGDNLLARLFSSVYLGDLTSVYLALLTNTDPEPVPLIEGFKKQLDAIPFV